MRSLRWKIILLTMLLVFVPLYTVNRYAVDAFNRFTSRSLEGRMIDTAYTAGWLYRDGFELGQRPGAEAVLQEIGRETGMLIRLFGPDGRLLVQGGGLDPSPPMGEDLPEVAEACRGRYKARWALTPERDFVFYYTAVPIKTGERVDLVAHVTCHTGPIIQAILRMFRDQRSALLMSLGMAALLSALLALTITRRLRRLNHAVAAYGRGEADVRFATRGGDEIAKLAAGFERMTGEIARRNLYNRDFVSTLLHELKAPLTAIKGAAELLGEGAAEKPEARNRFLANITYQADRMDRLVNELNSLTRLDVESLERPRTVVDYPDLVRSILERLELVFEPPRASLEVNLSSEPLQVRVVESHIEQVLTNLLDNAYRYTPCDGVVRLQVLSRDGVVETVVEDTGPGIAEVNLGRVFDRFFTTESKDPSRSFGTGLGLAVVKRIVENHEGFVRADNTPGGGARFVFTLPLES